MPDTNGSKFERDGPAEAYGPAKEDQIFMDYLRSAGGDIHMGYSLDDHLSEQVPLIDVVEAATVAIRPREKITVFMQATNDLDLSLEVVPIYTRDNAEHIAPQARLYATRLLLVHGIVHSPETLTPDFIYEKGETHVCLKITDPKKPGQAMDEMTQDRLGERISELSPRPPELAGPDDSLIDTARQDLGLLFARLTPQEAHEAGAYYFRDVFRDDLPLVTELEALYIGSIALGHVRLKGQARLALYEHALERYLQYPWHVDRNNVSLIETAMRKERRDGGSLLRIKRLSDAAIELGQPRRRRLMGTCATKYAQLQGRLNEAV